jgi:hypothetical protein
LSYILGCYNDADEQEEERESHQRKKMHQRKKHRKKHPELESVENNGREKETTVRWVEGEKRKEND